MNYNFIFLASLFFFINAFARSPFRPTDPLMPEIITKWLNQPETYHFKSYHLEYFPIFKKFDLEHIKDNFIPKEKIYFRNNSENNENFVYGTKLIEQAQELLHEIDQQKKVYKNFKILKNSDFNIKSASGQLVLKFKDYPFVLKLIRETPESFVQPFSKGWQPAGFFILSGGINRYLCGLTRIKNLEEIRKAIDKSPYWSSRLDVPRKWFWIPSNIPWFELIGKNIGPNKEERLVLPSVYALIVDEIKCKDLSILNPDDREFTKNLTNYLGNRFDPNIRNLVREVESNKYVIIDSEHFASMMGLKERMKFENYPEWFYNLGKKYISDKFSRNKKFRRSLQSRPTNVFQAIT